MENIAKTTEMKLSEFDRTIQDLADKRNAIQSEIDELERAITQIAEATEICVSIDHHNIQTDAGRGHEHVELNPDLSSSLFMESDFRQKFIGAFEQQLQIRKQRLADIPIPDLSAVRQFLGK